MAEIRLTVKADNGTPVGILSLVKSHYRFLLHKVLELAIIKGIRTRCYLLVGLLGRRCASEVLAITLSMESDRKLPYFSFQ